MKKKEAQKQIDAFDYYYRLGDTRTLQKVADDWIFEGRSYGYSTIRLWAKDLSWDQKIAELDKSQEKRIAKETVKEIADVKLDTLRDVEKLIAVVKEAIETAVDELKSGTLKIKSAQDLDYATKAYERLVRLALLLRGEDIEKQDNAPLVQFVGFDFSHFPNPDIELPKPEIDPRKVIEMQYESEKNQRSDS